MNPLTDEGVEKLLTRVGRELSPSRKRLQSALGVSSMHERERSPLLIISTYMSTYTTIGVALVAIVVIAGGAYFLRSPSAPRILMQKSTVPISKVTTQVMPQIVAADGSIDAVSAALAADLVSQTAAVGVIDQSVNASVSTLGAVTNTTNLYDTSSF